MRHCFMNETAANSSTVAVGGAVTEATANTGSMDTTTISEVIPTAPTIEESLRNMTMEGRIALQGWNLLHNSMKRHKPIECVLTTASIEEKDGEYKAVMNAQVKAANAVFNVKIPFEEFFANPPKVSEVGIDMRSPRGKKVYADRQANILRGKLEQEGTKVDVYFTDMQFTSMEEYRIIASRAAAARDIYAQYCGGVDSRGRKHEAKVKKGDRVTATVTNIASNAVIVSVFGVETLIPLRSLTYAYIPNLEAMASHLSLSVGKVIEVEIDSFKPLTDGRCDIQVNLKYRELALGKKMWEDKTLAERSQLTAVISSITQAEINRNGLPQTSILLTAKVGLNEYPIVLSAKNTRFSGSADSYGTRLQPGTKVGVRVRKTNDRGFVRCEINSVIQRG